jgi:glycosyltransferase involved in cell wall biosynthesis
VTEEDATVLREELGVGSEIWVLPNIHPVSEISRSFSERHDLLFIGNFGHPPNTDAALYFCGQVLPKIHPHLPDVRLYIVGANPLPVVRALASDHVIVTGYVPTVVPFLDICRISVAPLRYGAGMKGKIGEALAHGIPVVTTPIGAEGLHIVNGRHALVVNDANEFAEAVIHLYCNERLWKQMSQEGRSLITRQCSPEVVKGTVSALVKSLSAEDRKQLRPN